MDILVLASTGGSSKELRHRTAKTPTQKRSLDIMKPKRQKSDMIKCGKVWNTYLQKPHVVCQGAEKSVQQFNEWFRQQNNDNWDPFFRKTEALLILWDDVKKITRRQEFEGYLQNIVAYTLAWLFHLTDSRIDLERIRRKQKAGDAILNALETMPKVVDDHLRDTSLTVTEYCKEEDCWNRLKLREFSLPATISDEYVKENRARP